jgi:hypothetical protein
LLSPDNGRGFGADFGSCIAGVYVGAVDAVKDIERRGRGNICDSMDIGEVGRDSGLIAEQADAQASMPSFDLSTGFTLNSISIPRPLPNESVLGSNFGVAGFVELEEDF